MRGCERTESSGGLAIRLFCIRTSLRLLGAELWVRSWIFCGTDRSNKVLWSTVRGRNRLCNGLLSLSCFWWCFVCMQVLSSTTVCSDLTRACAGWILDTSGLGVALFCSLATLWFRAEVLWFRSCSFFRSRAEASTVLCSTMSNPLRRSGAHSSSQVPCQIVERAVFQGLAYLDTPRHVPCLSHRP